MEALPELVAVFDVVRAVATRFPTASDAELLADLDGIEAVGRVVDAWRVAAAAEVERRSPVRAGEESLAFRSGAKDGGSLVAHVARIPHRDATRRVGIGAALAPRAGLPGDALPGRFPVLADAVSSGAVGVEAARVIVQMLDHVRSRVKGFDLLGAAEAELTRCASTDAVDVVQAAAHWWQEALDPDGPEPDERAQRRKRAFSFGRVYADGAVSFSGVATAEDVAVLRELFQSRRRTGAFIRTPAGGDPDSGELGENDGMDPGWREDTAPDGGSPRNRLQQDYDTLLETVRAGIAAEAAGAAATGVTHEVVIQATVADVEARRGSGWTAGIMAGLPMPVIERKACAEPVRLLITGHRGEPLYLSRAQRTFTAAQKKALTVAARGCCQIPGCTTPAPYLEAHHVDWWSRDGGATDIGNGIMLCSYHHHLIHSTVAPIKLVKWDGDVYVVPRDWYGPPEERHRRQRGPGPDPNRRAA